MTNLSNYTFESIARDMTVGMIEYNKLVYTTAKVVTKFCSPKRKRKVNAIKKPSWKQKNKRGNKTSMRGTIYSEWVRKRHETPAVNNNERLW